MDRSELKEKNRTIREQIGKFFLDMAKLSFAGVVLAKMAYIRPEDSFMSVVTTITVGSLLTISFLFIYNTSIVYQVDFIKKILWNQLFL